MIFKNKETGQEMDGVPVSAIIQLSSHPAHTESFALYECLDGHGFFLRATSEFATKFKAAYEGGSVIWKHMVKGGRYIVHPGLYLYEGDDITWELGVHDGHEVKAYIYRNGDLRFTNMFDAKFVRIREPGEKTPNVDAIDAKLSKMFHKRLKEPEKGIRSDEGFITVYRESPFHIALVSRDWTKDVKARGDDLKEVMQAAEIILRSKQ